MHCPSQKYAIKQTPQNKTIQTQNKTHKTTTQIQENPQHIETQKTEKPKSLQNIILLHFKVFYEKKQYQKCFLKLLKDFLSKYKKIEANRKPLQNVLQSYDRLLLGIQMAQTQMSAQVSFCHVNLV